MARYRKVDPRIWNDEKFNDLSRDGKLAFLFVLTHPHMTSIGAMRASFAGLAAELGVDAKAFREAFAKGLLAADEKACFVGLPNYAKYNRPESPNVVRHWRDASDQVPECEEKRLQLQRLKAFTEALGKAFGEAFAEAFPESRARARTIEKTLRDEPRNSENPADLDPEPGSEVEPDQPAPRRPKATPAQFEAFWREYPKKADRKRAVAVWAKLHADQVPAIMHGLDRWQHSRQWRDGFVHDPTTWLRQERWTDETIDTQPTGPPPAPDPYAHLPRAAPHVVAGGER